MILYFLRPIFLSVNIFQGEGGMVNRTIFIYCIAGVGVNPGNLLCTTCVRPGCKRYTVGGIWGGDLTFK